MPDLIPGAPATVAAALDRLKDELTAAAKGNLAGLILYGGLARGRYRPGKSDINVIVLLHDATAAALAAIAPALRTARRAAGVDPLLLTPAEVARVADAFPTKFLDIKHHHIVLAGTDPFAELEVSRERIRLRVEQELCNLLLRLRHGYIALGSDAAMLTQALARVARPLALGLQALLQLAGKEVPDRSADIFEAAVAAFGLEREPLARLAELRQNPRPTGDVAALYQGVLAAVARAADTADQMKEPRP
jgi:predicted nucleotidyltransferase